jgi:uncharacterized membrane protein
MVYGVNLLVCALAWYVMQFAVFRTEGPASRARQAVGSDVKGKISPFVYLVGLASAAVLPVLAVAVYTVVAVMWLVPDRRFERAAARPTD